MNENNNNNNNNQCIYHKSSLNYICLECDELVCSNCCLIDQQHSGHKISDKNIEFKFRHDLIPSIENIIKNKKILLEECKSKFNQLEIEKNNNISEIKDNYNNIIQQLNNIQNNYINKIKNGNYDYSDFKDELDYLNKLCRIDTPTQNISNKSTPQTQTQTQTQPKDDNGDGKGDKSSSKNQHLKIYGCFKNLEGCFKILIRKPENIDGRVWRGTIKFYLELATFWMRVLDSIDPIIITFVIFSFYSIDMTFFWTSILTIILNFSILIGRQIIMWEYILESLEARLAEEHTYYKALAPVDSAWGNKLISSIIIILAMLGTSLSLICQCIHYNELIDSKYFLWEVSPYSESNIQVFNTMFALNAINIICIIVVIIVYFNLIGCVEYSLKRTQTNIYYKKDEVPSLKLEPFGSQTDTQARLLYYSYGHLDFCKYCYPYKIQLILVLSNRKHYKKFARELCSNDIYIQVVHFKTRKF